MYRHNNTLYRLDIQTSARCDTLLYKRLVVDYDLSFAISNISIYFTVRRDYRGIAYLTYFVAYDLSCTTLKISISSSKRHAGIVYNAICRVDLSYPTLRISIYMNYTIYRYLKKIFTLFSARICRPIV